MSENREYYIYEHIRLDNNTCFYVGKGKGKRADKLSRNPHHDRISKKYGHAVYIVADNLTEEEALELEQQRIEYYVFELGYGIDIEGYNDYDHKEDNYLTNLTFGGDGISGYRFSKESKEHMSKIRKREKLSEETLSKMSKNNSGENNNMYGKHHTEESKKLISEHKKGMQTGLDSPVAKQIICLTTGEVFITVTQAYEKYGVARSDINKVCKGINHYAGKILINGEKVKLTWKYIDQLTEEEKILFQIEEKIKSLQ